MRGAGLFVCLFVSSLGYHETIQFKNLKNLHKSPTELEETKTNYSAHPSPFV